MFSCVKSTLIKYLPPVVVYRIKELRKKRRQAERFSLNQGKDIVVPVQLDQISFSMHINPYLNGGVDDDIYKTGNWEPEITTEIFTHLPKGGTFLDIGANIGYHSLCAAAFSGGSGRVFSFEPLPRLQEQFKRSIVLNNFATIKIKPVALADVAGVATLSLVDENVGASSLKDVATERSVGSAVTVEVATLDAYRDEIGKVDVIKIDIEGSEFEALKGGESLLKSSRPVVILEFSPHVYENEYKGKSIDLFMYLKNLGYTMKVIGQPSLNIEKMLHEGRLQELHQNFLCIPA